MDHDVARARQFAVDWHGVQRYGDAPYVVHLDAVVAILAPYGKLAQIVGYLHDLREDTAVTRELIEAHFGAQVAACVELISDLEGETRAERKAISNAKMAAAGPDLYLALIVKVADRLANAIANLEEQVLHLFEMYRGEYPAFRAAVYRPGLCDPLWERIEAALHIGKPVPQALFAAPRAPRQAI